MAYGIWSERNPGESIRAINHQFFDVKRMPCWSQTAIQAINRA